MPGTRRFALPRVRPIHALTLTLAVALLVAVGGWVVAVCGWPGEAPRTPTPTYNPNPIQLPRPGSGMHIEAPTGTVIEAVSIPPPPAALQLGSLTPTDTSAAKAIYQHHARH